MRLDLGGMLLGNSVLGGSGSDVYRQQQKSMASGEHTSLVLKVMTLVMVVMMMSVRISTFSCRLQNQVINFPSTCLKIPTWWKLRLREVKH